MTFPPATSGPCSRQLDVAVEAARAGGDVLRRYYGRTFRVAFKGELNLVTEADTESETTVVDLLQERLPGVAVLAEEGGQRAGDATQRFIVDPLDGTTNFAHGYPLFAVSIAYEREGEIVAGVVYDPVRDELFTAQRGAGSFLNGERIHVSKTAELDQALLVTGFPYDLREDVAGTLRMFTRFISRARGIRRDGSAALDLAYLAMGRFDGFFEEKLGPWDTAAGSLLVQEAGGTVSDFAGGRFSCFGKNVLASNGPLHDSMLEVLAD